MNAVDFIKKYTIDKAREVIEFAPSNAVYYWQIPRCKHGVYSSLEQKQGRAILLEELKHLVKSIELVEQCGGIDSIKDTFDFAWKHGADDLTEYGERLRQALADYKLIYGDSNAGTE